MAIKTVTIVDGNDLYFFDCILRVSKSMSGELSTYAMEDGYSSTDNYANHPTVIEINGMISNAKMVNQAGQMSEMGEFLAGLELLKESGRFFSISIGRMHRLLHNCLIENMSYNHDDKTGENAAEVSVTIKSQRTARAARIVSTPIPFDDYVDTTSTTKEGSGSGEAVDDTNIAKMRTNISNLIGRDQWGGIF